MTKLFRLILAALSMLLFALPTNAQTSESAAKALVDEGVKLHDAGKYDDAMEKYKQAIKLDPNYSRPYYEMAYTLRAAGVQKQGIPYLEKYILLQPKAGDAYDLLGSIYDDDDQPAKAREYYTRGIAVAPTYQRLYFNYGLYLFRQQQYEEAEKNTITAIKLDKNHASSQRLLAQCAYKMRQLGVSLLAWSDFLLIEPNTERSEEAVKGLIATMKFGIREEGWTPGIESYSGSPGNNILQNAMIAATANKKGLSAMDTIELRLTSAFQMAHIIADDKKQPFFGTFYADYFEKLAKSGNVPAFSKYIMVSSYYRDENLNWLKSHPTEYNNLGKWVNKAEHEL